MSPTPTALGRRERKQQQTRQAILDAAHELFGSRGFTATSVAQVADAADVAVATVFNHFACKEALFFEGRCPWQGLGRHLTEHPDDHRTAPELLALLVDVVTDHLERISVPERLPLARVLVQRDTPLARWEQGLQREAERCLAGHLARHAPADVADGAARIAALVVTEARTQVEQHRLALVEAADRPGSPPPPVPDRAVLAGRLQDVHDLVLAQLARSAPGPSPSRGPLGP